MQQLIDLGIIQVDHTQATPRLEDEEIHEWTEEDQAEWDQASAEEEAAEKQRLAEIAEAESHGTITVEQAAAIAKEAVIQEYGLTKEQSDKLEFETDFTYVSSQDDEPLVDLCFTLWQKEGDTFTGENFTEKDGQYWVTINLKTGIIEDVLYDAGLAANG